MDTSAAPAATSKVCRSIYFVGGGRDGQVAPIAPYALVGQKSVAGLPYLPNRHVPSNGRLGLVDGEDHHEQPAFVELEEGPAHVGQPAHFDDALIGAGQELLRSGSARCSRLSAMSAALTSSMPMPRLMPLNCLTGRATPAAASSPPAAALPRAPGLPASFGQRPRYASAL